MIYFISDLHLEEKRPDITGAFFYFLDQIESKATQLYILGDFFEAWVGDDENTALQQKVKARLKQLVESGTATFFMAGNRDFLIGDTFANETGVQILDEPSVIELNGLPTLLIHGDSLCTQDLAYMKLRQMIRAPGFIETFLARPLKDRQTTARQLREMSQASGQNKSSEIMDVTPDEVVSLLAEYGVSQMIHGHTHRPAVHELTANGKAATRFVLGDWDSKIWYISVDQNGIQLHDQDFPAQAEQFA